LREAQAARSWRQATTAGCLPSSRAGGFDPLEPVGVGERTRVGTDRDPVRAAAIDGHTRILRQRAASVQSQLHGAPATLELDVLIAEATLDGQPVLQIEAVAGADIGHAEQQHYVLDLPGDGAVALLLG